MRLAAVLALVAAAAIALGVYLLLLDTGRAKLFVVRIPTADLDLEFDVNPAWNTGTKIYERVTALVDGEVCATADLLEDRQNGFVVLRVGLSDQPEACRRDGATVSFAFGRDAQWPLQATLVLKRNTYRGPGGPSNPSASDWPGPFCVR